MCRSGLHVEAEWENLSRNDKSVCLARQKPKCRAGELILGARFMKMPTRLSLCLCTCICACATPQSQTRPSGEVATPPMNMAALAADTAVRKAELAKISGLVGTWTGPGWRILPSGERVEYDQTVLVTSKMGGQAFTIEGNSVRRPASGPQGSGSLAIVTWEPSEGRYAFRSFSGGRLTDADGQLIAPDTFQWMVKGPPVGLRFTVTFAGDWWRETGEVSRDGNQSWTTSYQLEMRKSPTP
jgi:hypothetical protein